MTATLNLIYHPSLEAFFVFEGDCQEKCSSAKRDPCCSRPLNWLKWTQSRARHSECGNSKFFRERLRGHFAPGISRRSGLDERESLPLHNIQGEFALPYFSRSTPSSEFNYRISRKSKSRTCREIAGIHHRACQVLRGESRASGGVLHSGSSFNWKGSANCRSTTERLSTLCSLSRGIGPQSRLDSPRHRCSGGVIFSSSCDQWNSYLPPRSGSRTRACGCNRNRDAVLLSNTFARTSEKGKENIGSPYSNGGARNGREFRSGVLK